jgi:hypothetical protein
MKRTPIKVIFRKFKNGAILALFPYELEDDRGSVLSYQHVGQHGEADYNHCLDITKPATPREYAELLSELNRIGYAVTVITRKPRASKAVA